MGKARSLRTILKLNVESQSRYAAVAPLGPGSGYCEEPLTQGSLSYQPLKRTGEEANQKCEEDRSQRLPACRVRTQVSRNPFRKLPNAAEPTQVYETGEAGRGTLQARSLRTILKLNVESQSRYAAVAPLGPGSGYCEEPLTQGSLSYQPLKRTGEEANQKCEEDRSQRLTACRVPTQVSRNPFWKLPNAAEPTQVYGTGEAGRGTLDS